jgi:hypothetical protein
MGMKNSVFWDIMQSSKQSSAWYLLHACFFAAYYSTSKIEATYSSETSVEVQRATRRYIQEVKTLCKIQYFVFKPSKMALNYNIILYNDEKCKNAILV